MKEQKEKLINHLVYMDSPPKEGEEYQWLGGYILTWKDKPATVGMRDLEEDELALLVQPGEPGPECCPKEEDYDRDS